MMAMYRLAARAGLVLLALAFFGLFISDVRAFTNGQAASLVLGQPDFTTNTQPNTTASTMNFPQSIAIDAATGKVFIADQFNNRVLRFGSGAALVNGAAAEAVLGQANFSANASATTQTGMWNPSGVAVDSAGRLWVADLVNNRVLRFDAAATLANGAPANGVLGQANFTTRAPINSQTRMSSPNGVAVDSGGKLWVADTSNNRVLRFDSAATLANGAAASGVLGQANFTSIADTTSQSGMSNPRGVAVDSSGRLWVADANNNRVLRFNTAATLANGAAASAVLGQPNFTTKTNATTQSGMDGPYGVAVDSTGTTWVADTNNDRALRFDAAATLANGAAASGVLGQPDFTTDNPATSRSGFIFSTGVTIDTTGRVWIADAGNNRVLRFDNTTQIYLPLIVQ